jgi:hypothetical protein
MMLIFAWIMGFAWEPIFDAHGTGSMGAIAIDDTNPSLVWAGTGEATMLSVSETGDSRKNRAP